VAAASPKGTGPDNAAAAVEAAMAAQAGKVVSPAAAAPPVATTAAEAPAPAPARTAQPKASRGKATVAAAPSPQPSGGKRREVRAGETLYAIALESRPEAVSLDQMLAALYRGNPEAFAGENMNRLLAGAVLQVPAAEDAGAIPRAEARALIEAHSSDLAAYRQRLAAKPAAAGGDEPQRRASGSVQARVQDRKQAAAPTPDQLKLSRSEVKASATPTPDATLSRQAEARELAQREAEVQRNVEALRQLKSGSASAGGGAGAGPAGDGAAVARTAAAAPSTGASMPGATLVAAAPPAALAAAGDAAAPAAPAPSTPASAVAEPAAVAASAASAPAPGASEPVLASRLQDSLLSSPYILAAGAALVLSVAGLTVLGLLRRRRTPAPASAPGAQERAEDDPGLSLDDAQAPAARPPRPAFEAALEDATAVPQDAPVLDDAVVDPQPSARPADPLAEAEVYLAYGRVDEAVALLRAAVDAEPRRSDIVFKLLELHASRQEVEAFEAVADVIYQRTGGQGAEWARVVALQRTLVPEVDEMAPTDVAPPEPPARVATPPAAVQAAASRASVAAAQTAPAARPLAERQEPTLGPEPADLPATDFALDMDVDTADATRPEIAREGLDLGGVERPEAAAPTGPAGNALERKLALAEEFIQIGDVEGARDLLGEVGSQGDGPLRERARRLLDALG
jgi:pilus assembly protein FimV